MDYVISIINTYITNLAMTGAGAVSTLTDNGDGTYDHDDGNGIITVIVGGATSQIYSSTGDITVALPLVKTISGAVDIVDISLYSDDGVGGFNDISDSVHINRTLNEVTFTTNIDDATLLGVTIKIIYTL